MVRKHWVGETYTREHMGIRNWRTMPCNGKICLLNVFYPLQTLSSSSEHNSISVWVCLLFFCYSRSLFVFYRGTETILFNDRSHTFNANIRRCNRWKSNWSPLRHVSKVHVFFSTLTPQTLTLCLYTLLCFTCISAVFMCVPNCMTVTSQNSGFAHNQWQYSLDTVIVFMSPVRAFYSLYLLLLKTLFMTMNLHFLYYVPAVWCLWSNRFNFLFLLWCYNGIRFISEIYF